MARAAKHYSIESDSAKYRHNRTTKTVTAQHSGVEKSVTKNEFSSSWNKSALYFLCISTVLFCLGSTKLVQFFSRMLDKYIYV